MRRLLRRARTWWYGHGLTLRTAAIALWLIGGVITLLGLYGDRHQWWDSSPFATNLVSSLAGASFGVPVALLVIATLSAQQASITARREALQFAKRLLHRMAGASGAILGSSSGDNRAGDLIASLRPVREFARTHPNGYKSGKAEIETHGLNVRAAETSFVLLNDLPTLIGRCAYDCASAWQLFQTEAQLRLAERGVPPLDYERAMRIDAAVRALTRADRRLPWDLRLSAVWERYGETDTTFFTDNPAWLSDSDSDLLSDPPARTLVEIVDAIEAALTAVKVIALEASAGAASFEHTN